MEDQVKIGGVSIPNKVVLAPMAGITDKAFRLIARAHGCGLVYTEMISAKALTYRDVKTKALLDLTGEKPPIAVQLFGSEPEVMAEGASIAVQQGADIVDVNMGCPVPKIVKNGEGSALLEKPGTACRIVRAMAEAVQVPVTVKMRIGWNRENIVAVDFARRLEEAGASAIAVHGRTRDQYYSGKADWSVIREVKKAVTVPVIGNGDIWSPSDAARMLEETGCDAVMLGRGVLGNPWLVSNTILFLKGEEFNLPGHAQRIRAAVEHLDLMIELKGELAGAREMRKHLAWYLKGLPHTAHLKEGIFKAKTRAEMVELLEEYLRQLIQRDRR
ncbi:MAG: tRNA dihydrouridine synthase DusB [Peptococcaceae bacterium]|jgi:nifR3 family TIM-barrel protein|nr:tRNA dihydrouridine synthase DusB [Peptococcaceae bacterium]MDH7523692.1 tRNA dihydrouridine synthase DusB [Peptococcaceae bacterium]